jgi:hypothetical protein
MAQAGENLNREGYPVEWRGRTLHLSDLTEKAKQQFCAVVYRTMLGVARSLMDAPNYIRFERSLTAQPPQWTTEADDCVAAALDVAGPHRAHYHRELNRILFGEPEMDDAELDELIAAKEADPTSDYCLAMKQVKEAENPKAPRGGRGSPAPTDGSE